MGQGDHSTRLGKYQQLGEGERYKIEALNRAKVSISETARQLGRDRRTIQREMKRGTVEQIKGNYETKLLYCADAGERVKKERAANKGRPLKIGNNHALANHLEQKIVQEQYSPDAALAQWRTGHEADAQTVSTKTVYNYIDMGLFAGIRNGDLPVKKDRKQRKPRLRRAVALNNTKGRSIEERPEEVGRRQSEGHWEMDCVEGRAGSKACLLVMTERKQRTELIFKMASKSQDEVVRALDQLEKRCGKQFPEIFKSIMVDNGCEFLSSARLERSSLAEETKRTTVYYAHPYSAWERGSNENQNKLIRRFVPKGTDIRQLEPTDIERIQYWMNHYPRRKLGYHTPAELCTSGVLDFVGSVRQ
jgi:IS30 family transposase